MQPSFKKAFLRFATIWDESIASEVQDKLTIFFAEKEIRWLTIPERSPWAEGLYERIVGLVKRALRKVLWRASISEDGLATLLTEVEGVLNCRPLLSLSTDVNDQRVLTPADFISPSSRLGLPPSNNDLLDPDYKPSDQTPSTLLKDWKRAQHRLDQFWRLWYTQYLQELKEVQKLKFKAVKGEVPRPPLAGELVLIEDPTPRLTWKVARIKENLYSADGSTRYVKLQLPNGAVTRRGMRNLVPLEAEIREEIPTLPSTCQEAGENVKKA